jgi:ribonuclease D
MPSIKAPKNSKMVAASSQVSATFTPRVNEEINNKLNQFIADNPKLVQVVKNMPREYLERKYFLHKMQQKNRREAYTNKVAEWINASKQRDLKEAFEQIVKNLPESARQRELISEVKQYIKKAGIKLG